MDLTELEFIDNTFLSSAMSTVMESIEFDIRICKRMGWTCEAERLSFAQSVLLLYFDAYTSGLGDENSRDYAKIHDELSFLEPASEEVGPGEIQYTSTLSGSCIRDRKFLIDRIGRAVCQPSLDFINEGNSSEDLSF
jgi:hypothetical protein